MDKLARLKPVFDKDGTVTAGNASSINDAAAAVVLAARPWPSSAGCSRWAGWSPTATPASTRSTWASARCRRCKVLEKTGAEPEGHRRVRGQRGVRGPGAGGGPRARAADPDRTNPNGSGISLGHPIGATGCILTIKALYELHRTGGRYALVTMCIGGGQGIAAIFERV